MSSGYDPLDAKAAHRWAFTNHMDRLAKRLLETDDHVTRDEAIKNGFRIGRVLLASELLEDEPFMEIMARIETEPYFEEHATRLANAGILEEDEIDEVAERERDWARLCTIQIVAARCGVWDKERGDLDISKSLRLFAPSLADATPEVQA